MPAIGPMEILVVGVLALIVFGPDKLPEIARTVGAFMKQVRAMADEVKQEFSDGFEVGDEPDDEEVAKLAKNDSEVARLNDEDDSTAEVARLNDEDDSTAEVARLDDEDDSTAEVARLDDEDDSTAAPAAEDRTDSGPAREPDGHSEHPVADAIKAEREASGRSEGA